MKTITIIKPKNYAVQMLDDKWSERIQSKYKTGTLQSYVPLVYTVNMPSIYEQHINYNLNVILSYIPGSRASYVKILNKKEFPHVDKLDQVTLWNTDIVDSADFNQNHIFFENITNRSKNIEDESYSFKTLKKYDSFATRFSSRLRFLGHEGKTESLVISVFKANRRTWTKPYKMTHLPDLLSAANYKAINVNKHNLCLLTNYKHKHHYLENCAQYANKSFAQNVKFNKPYSIGFRFLTQLKGLNLLNILGNFNYQNSNSVPELRYRNENAGLSGLITNLCDGYSNKFENYINFNKSLADSAASISYKAYLQKIVKFYRHTYVNDLIVQQFPVADNVSYSKLWASTDHELTYQKFHLIKNINEVLTTNEVFYRNLVVVSQMFNPARISKQLSENANRLNLKIFDKAISHILLSATKKYVISETSGDIHGTSSDILTIKSLAASAQNKLVKQLHDDATLPAYGLSLDETTNIIYTQPDKYNQHNHLMYGSMLQQQMLSTSPIVMKTKHLMKQLGYLHLKKSRYDVITRYLQMQLNLSSIVNITSAPQMLIYGESNKAKRLKKAFDILLKFNKDESFILNNLTDNMGFKEFWSKNIKFSFERVKSVNAVQKSLHFARVLYNNLYNVVNKLHNFNQLFRREHSSADYQLDMHHMVNLSRYFDSVVRKGAVVQYGNQQFLVEIQNVMLQAEKHYNTDNINKRVNTKSDYGSAYSSLWIKFINPSLENIHNNTYNNILHIRTGLTDVDHPVMYALNNGIIAAVDGYRRGHYRDSLPVGATGSCRPESIHSFFLYNISSRNNIAGKINVLNDVANMYGGSGTNSDNPDFYVHLLKLFKNKLYKLTVLKFADKPITINGTLNSYIDAGTFDTYNSVFYRIANMNSHKSGDHSALEQWMYSNFQKELIYTVNHRTENLTDMESTDRLTSDVKVAKQLRKYLNNFQRFFTSELRKVNNFYESFKRNVYAQRYGYYNDYSNNLLSKKNIINGSRKNNFYRFNKYPYDYYSQLSEKQTFKYDNQRPVLSYNDGGSMVSIGEFCFNSWPALYEKTESKYLKMYSMNIMPRVNGTDSYPGYSLIVLHSGSIFSNDGSQFSNYDSLFTHKLRRVNKFYESFKRDSYALNRNNDADYLYSQLFKDYAAYDIQMDSFYNSNKQVIALNKWLSNKQTAFRYNAKKANLSHREGDKLLSIKDEFRLNKWPVLYGKTVTKNLNIYLNEVLSYPLSMSNLTIVYPDSIYKSNDAQSSNYSNMISNYFPNAALIYDTKHSIAKVTDSIKWEWFKTLGNAISRIRAESDYLRNSYRNFRKIILGKVNNYMIERQFYYRAISSKVDGKMREGSAKQMRLRAHESWQMFNMMPKIIHTVKQLIMVIKDVAIKRHLINTCKLDDGLSYSRDIDSSKLIITGTDINPKISDKNLLYLYNTCISTNDNIHSFNGMVQIKKHGSSIALYDVIRSLGKQGSNRNYKDFKSLGNNENYKKYKSYVNYPHSGIYSIGNKLILTEPINHMKLMIRNIGVSGRNVSNSSYFVSDISDYVYTPDMSHAILRNINNSSAQPEIYEYKDSTMVVKQNSTSDSIIKTVNTSQRELEKEINKRFENLEKKINDKSLSVKSVSDRVYSSLVRDLRMERQRRGN